MDNEEIIDNMKLAKQLGLIKNLGVSVYTPDDSFRAMDSQFFNHIQLPFNVLDQRLLNCDFFEKAQKCKYCLNFSLTQDELGTCMNKYDAYPEMNVVTCKDYVSK